MICRITAGVIAAACQPTMAAVQQVVPGACVVTTSFNICVAQQQPTLDLVSNPVLASYFRGKEKRLLVEGDAKVYLFGQGLFRQPLSAVDGSTPHARLTSLMKKTASIYMVPRACFFTDGKQKGRSFCREPGADMGMPANMSRAISSISVPDGLRVYASNDLLGSGWERWVAYDNADVDMATLLRNKQQDSIRKIKVARSRVACDRGCPVGVSDSYALDAIFSDMWDSHIFDRKTFQFTFRAGRRSNFDVSLDGSAGASFILHGGALYIYHSGTGRAQFSSVSIGSDTRYLSVAIELITNEYIRYQVIALNKNKGVLGISPVFSKFPNYMPVSGEIKNDPNRRNTFTIKSKSPDVQIENLTFALLVKPAKNRKRTATGLALCYFIPILAIYNYVASGECNQPDRLYRYLKDMIVPKEALMLHVAGDSDAKPRDPSARNEIPVFSKVHEIMMGGRSQFQAYDISRACRLPIEAVLKSHRAVKRGTNNQCISRAQDILSAFNRVFGEAQNVSLFNRVIANILETGSTGYASSEPQAEQRLVDLVAASAGFINEVALAYASGAALYYSSVQEVMNPDYAREPAAVPTPAPYLEHAPLGEYRLDLSRVATTTATPRVWQNMRWTAAGENFTTTVFPARQAKRSNPNFAALSSELQSWASQFDDPASAGEAGHAEVPPLLPMSVRRWGYALSTTFALEATQGFAKESYIVAVYYRGRLVSTLLGEIKGERGEVISIISHPDNVLEPYTDSSLRGGGSRALAAFIKLCRERNVKNIMASAVTPPSATIHTRLGFRLSGEL